MLSVEKKNISKEKHMTPKCLKIESWNVLGYLRKFITINSPKIAYILVVWKKNKLINNMEDNEEQLVKFANLFIEYSIDLHIEWCSYVWKLTLEVKLNVIEMF